MLRRTIGALGRIGQLLLPPLIVGAAILALLHADPANRVAYVKALVWPVVIALGYIALRNPIHERLRSVLKLSVGGVADMEFGKREEADANAALERTAREVALTVVDEPDTATAPDPVALERHQRREAVEDALKAGAKWGYNMARLYATPPEPLIEWDENGNLNITGAEGIRRDPQPAAVGTNRFTGAWAARYVRRPEDIVADAEEEVRRLEAEHVRAKNNIGPEGFVALERLELAKKRLAKVDPDNHLLL
jgi:hypothetical protein